MNPLNSPEASLAEIENSQQQVDKIIYAGQIKLLYSYAPLAYSTTLINGLILVFIERTHVPLPVLLGWYGCLTLITVSRIGLVYRYNRVHPSPEAAHRWAWWYCIGVGLTGIAWGSAAVVLFPPTAIGHQVLVAFVLAGMSAAGLLVLAARLEAVVAFLLPALLPLSLQFFLQNSELHTAMGVMTLLYLGGLLSVATRMNRLIQDVLSLRFDNQALSKEISGRQWAEDALRASEAHLQRVLDGANDGFWDWNIVTGEVLVSRHGIKMLGYQPDEFPPYISSWEQLVHPSDVSLRQTALDMHFAGQIPRYQAEYRLRAKTGDWRWILDRGKVTARDAAGQPLWMAGAYTDTTDRRLVEEALCDTLVGVQHHDEQMTTLNRMIELLLSCETREEAYEIIGRGAARLFEGCTGSLLICGEGSSTLQVMATWGNTPSLVANFQQHNCWALRQREMYEVSDPAHNMLCQHFVHPPTHAYLCLPLTVRGETVGLLHLGAGSTLAGERFRELRTLAITVGESTKLVLFNLKLQEALREQAIRDPLTELFNRRYLDETLPRELHRQERAGEPLAVAMLDLDHFKRFNDTYGHEAGDAILRAVSNLLRRLLRAGDLACRYGGEELTVVLPGSSLDDARVRLDTMRQAIMDLRVLHQDDVLPTITISIGVAVAAVGETDASTLLNRADAALYQAKAQGRNRVVAANPGWPYCDNPD
ncbi:MAG: diguanylate cyclase [Candidatus Competibacteraceae bacterium]|nr:diguanylate cyclase [Candidatus Competibacteraceae bacterium]MCP5134028.1 diguanylate cyclase [Gammaproteobacteria bacterium]